MPINIEELGFNSFFSSQKLGGAHNIARITTQHNALYEGVSSLGPVKLSAAGALKLGKATTPLIGDWVVFENLKQNLKPITKIFKRNICLRRLYKEKTQILAANIDLVLIVNSADKTFAESRLKKYASLCMKDNIPFEIILNKKDLCQDIKAMEESVFSIFSKKPLFLNSLEKDGYAKLENILKPAKTSVIIGPSGSGKSTIINNLTGEKTMKTFQVREKDFKGRHTTTVRRMIFLKNGHMIIDTPGIKVILEPITLETADFDLIREKALSCKFSNCAHKSEPYCAVKKAVEEGLIKQEIYEEYLRASNKDETF